MKKKSENNAENAEKINDQNIAMNEFKIQSDRIKKILDEAIFKLKVVTLLPGLWENNAALLREYLDNKDVEYILYVCRDFMEPQKSTTGEPTYLTSITDILDKISLYSYNNRRGSTVRKSSFDSMENYEAHVSYAIDVLLKSDGLVQWLEDKSIESIDPLAASFIDGVTKLKNILEDKLNVSATEEINRENELKTAYRSSMMLSENIRELEEQLEKQREELGNEHEKKYAIMVALAERIEMLRARAQQDINEIVYESETKMMKDYLKSMERQEILSADAKQAVHQFDLLLEEHIHEEKLARAKKYKVETQLASWLAKYDQDIGDKQTEYEELETKYIQEKEEYNLLKEKFEDQDAIYVALMQEKEDEERAIYEEKAFRFLLNRSARRIQRCWRAYRERKKARRRGRKSKKGSAGKKGKKTAKKEVRMTRTGGPDPNALISGAFSSELLSDIKTKDDAFTKKDVVVDLNAD